MTRTKIKPQNQLFQFNTLSTTCPFHAPREKNPCERNTT